MNTETGQIYKTLADIEAAKQRGEPLAEISETVAALMEEGKSSMNRKARRAEAAKLRRLKKHERKVVVATG